MATISKTVNIRELQDTTEGKMHTHVKALEEQSKRGVIAHTLRDWCAGGFILDNLGHGLLATLVAQYDAGMLDGKNPRQQAEYIADLLMRTAWKDDSPAFAGGESSTEQPEPEVIDSVPALEATTDDEPEPARGDKIQTVVETAGNIAPTPEPSLSIPSDDSEDDESDLILSIA